MSLTNHHPHGTDFPKPNLAPIIFCPATRLYAPRPHHMPADEAHIYFNADSPECRDCTHLSGCEVRIREASFIEEAAQSV